MIPTKSNTAEQGCSPVSSNCVVWQGPSLSCINLCNGDTISDVTYKIATDLCAIKDQLDLTDLDLQPLIDFCATTNPAPTERTLAAVLDFIVVKIGCLNTTVEDLDAAIGSSGYVEPTLTLPTCLQYTDPVSATLVTQLLHRNFTLTLANKHCDLKAVVDGHTTQLSTLSGRVTVLENAVAAPLPTVTPECLLTPGVPTAMNVVLDELEAQYCNMRSLVGSNGQLAAASSQQPQNFNQTQALSVPGVMLGIENWNTTVTNIAQSLQNLWITVIDMREALTDLKASIAITDCSGFVLDYQATTDSAREVVYLDFNPLTIIPLLYENCTSQSTVTISDGTINKTFTVDLKTFAVSTTAFECTVAGSNVVGQSLNISQAYTVTVNGCIIKDGQSCSKTAIKTILVPCPIVTGVTAALV